MQAVKLNDKKIILKNFVAANVSCDLVALNENYDLTPGSQILFAHNHWSSTTPNQQISSIFGHQLISGCKITSSKFRNQSKLSYSLSPCINVSIFYLSFF